MIDRSQLLDYLERSPGRHVREIAAEFAVHDTTAAYHLERLEGDGKVFSRRVGRERNYFSRASTRAGVGGTLCSFLVQGIPASRRERLREVMDLLLVHGELALTELCRALQISDHTARKHLSRLEALGLVEFVRPGRGRASRARVLESSAVCWSMARAGAPCTLSSCVRDPAQARANAQ